jgi:Flavin reductase like domain
VPVDLQTFRDLMAGIYAPVTVGTTAKDDNPYGATVSAFASLSLDPPMVTVALDRISKLLAQTLQVGRFGVNVLARHQDEDAKRFAQRRARFSSASWYLTAASRAWPALQVARLRSQHQDRGRRSCVAVGRGRAWAAQRRAPLICTDKIYGTHSAMLNRPSTGISTAMRERRLNCARAAEIKRSLAPYRWAYRQGG